MEEKMEQEVSESNTKKESFSVVDITIRLLLIVMLALTFWFIATLGNSTNLGADKHFAENHVSRVDLLREEFGNETTIYPSPSLLNDYDTYFIVEEESDIVIARMWETPDGYSFDTQTLSEPYDTHAKSRQYDRYLNARIHNEKRGDPYNN